ncbi:MAG: DNA translocase FtsK 4TM domain-containing protein [Armatimonadota bacterium]
MTKPRPQRDSHLKRELGGIALVTAGVLLFVSLAWDLSGPLPKALSWLLTGLMGVGAYAVPAAAVVAGVALLLRAPMGRMQEVATGLALLFLVFLGLCHLYQVDVADIMREEVMRERGGALGAGITWVLRSTLRETGAYIVLFGLALAAVLLVSDVSGNDLLLGTGTLVRDAAVSAFSAVRGRWQGTAAGSASSRARRTRRRSANPPPRPLDAVVMGEQELELPVVEPVARAPTETAAQPARGEQLDLLDRHSLYQCPSLDLLEAYDEEQVGPGEAEITDNIMLVEDTLASFGVEAKVVHCERGPAVTRYEVEPARGIRVSKVANLADDLALALAAIDVRVEAPVPGKSVIGIEVPNRSVAIVPLRAILDTEKYRRSRSKLTFALGKDITGEPRLGDLARMPHLLLGGATNSGKSVCLNAIITSILFRASPREVKFVLIDPKRVELTGFDSIPHLASPVVHSAKEAADVLRKLIKEMERRYDGFALAGVRNIEEYNAQAEAADRLHYLVVVVDELADLMMQAAAEFEFSICRLAQLARATGIHLVIATQRPSVNVITGTIKANISSRISLAVASQADSRVIIDCNGAERLIGRGDMLFLPIEASKPMRIQGAYVSPREVERLVEFLREQGEPEYDIIPEVDEEESGPEGETAPDGDPLFEPAAEFAVSHEEASVSMLQRRFKIGYARAGRLIDMMEKCGIVGPYEGSKPRQVLMGPAELMAFLARRRQVEAEVAPAEPSGPSPRPTEEPALVAGSGRRGP